MRNFNGRIATLTLVLIAGPGLSTAAAARGTHRHYASRHHSGVKGYRHVLAQGRAPDFAPPGYVDAGVFSLAGPQGTGPFGGGGVLGTGLSNGTGLLGIGFLGL